MTNSPIKVGLRIDVDTFRGTRKGVPKLLEILNKYDISASFFFSVGPDNMGRHLWRLIRPDFFKKMLRSNAGSLYGYDILFKGTMWPGPNIGKKLGHVIKQTDDAGHEVGLHAWDHHKWQIKIDDMSAAQLSQEIEKGYMSLQSITGKEVVCSAVAGWRCNDQTIVEKEKHPFRYNSDCRGESIFIPKNGKTPQIPVTMPTYDELIGENGITDENYNDHIIQLIKPEGLNVYTIHAEVEGIQYADMFEALIKDAISKNIQFVPLGELLPENDASLQINAIENIAFEGREGWISQQAVPN
ncbi:4-deoxy-4-formamido-L-arabinose-phosphoundecaprenol deformylase [Vibrio sp. S4M6]|uniref:4-deoxy-4-formamido-L-arabinose- phosphoundecaprenol deformylase n=1 Tax=Vibrio sinus TaxID=2946865 RepID=UPI002029F6E9|nr:4-deoxy-4-formamido-L-arabinose-phosphoundecaprenol deformylase [Vibrio sinus]MCL9780059.1 4-deoxy-4-formamido-L-arabinose-phosphoundecaprenol deformylase [Vibrio sinus]